MTVIEEAKKAGRDALLKAAHMELHEIGEYTGCAHGPNGTRLYGCLPCAIEWHTARQVENAERADYHAKMLCRLSDELIAQKFAASPDYRQPQQGDKPKPG